VDASRYHPKTREGQKLFRLQIEDDIKRHMFSYQKWNSEMRDLATTSDRLEESMGRMLAIGSTIVEQSKQLAE
jgi:hypothetical protein